MEILDVKRESDTVYIFTDNIKEDIKHFIKKYKDEKSKIHLGYKIPSIEEYKFLGTCYPCIMLWYDYQEDLAKGAEEYFKLII